MNIGIIVLMLLFLGARASTGSPGSPTPPGCVGCCPGTSTYDGMIKARASLKATYGSWANTPWWAQLAHSLGYSQCPGYDSY